MTQATNNSLQGTNVGLFATCLVDMFRPNAGFAAAQLIEQTGCSVHVPRQGCCGQPNFNGGDNEGAIKMARAVLDAFSEFDYVVVPSASCAAMLKVHYPQLFTSPDDIEQARALAEKTYELTAFLVDVAGVTHTGSSFDGTVVMHHACSALRELDVRGQPEVLINGVAGARLKQLNNPEVCCGFGGLFCVKYPDISNRIASKKIADITATGDVDALVSTDLGCLLHLDGKMHRDNAPVKALHIAELLAGRVNEGNE